MTAEAKEEEERIKERIMEQVALHRAANENQERLAELLEATAKTKAKTRSRKSRRRKHALEEIQPDDEETTVIRTLTPSSPVLEPCVHCYAPGHAARVDPDGNRVHEYSPIWECAEPTCRSQDIWVCRNCYAHTKCPWCDNGESPNQGSDLEPMQWEMDVKNGISPRRVNAIQSYNRLCFGEKMTQRKK